MLHTLRIVWSGHTTSPFVSRRYHPFTNTTSLGFYTEQTPSLSPLKLKHCHLLCQASQDAVPLRNDELLVHEPSEMIVGILGGGQLARMLCEAASPMGIKVMVLDPRENCPASSLCYHHMVGSFDDSTTVEEFAKRCGLLTFEIEHVDVALLEKLEKQGVNCQPKASTIRIIQDKYQQMVHFSQHGIPLSDFMQIGDLEGAKKVGELFGYPLMIKSRRLAYDGRGNAVASSEEELPSAIDALGGFDRGLYVEKWAPFVKELAVIVVRGRENLISSYTIVETIHRDNICHIVKAPANVHWKIRERATEIACNAVNSLDGAGVFAVELFLTRDGQILLNEVAPRPHNSGHHTIESCYTSQFEQHLRAVLGLPLGDSSMKASAAVMYNILGEEEGEPGLRLARLLINRALTIPGANVHWYDKPVAPRVGIIMGSDSDISVMKSAVEILEKFGVPYEVKIVSAHRTPQMMFSYASSAHDRGIQVIIAGAGGAAHLPGMVAAVTHLPVIGVPVNASFLEGYDSLLSIVQMPKGVPVATVGINNATNAGLLAVQYLGIANDNIRMIQYREEQKESVLIKGDKVEKYGLKSYLNEMRKQGKMGHITVVGDSLADIESNLTVMVEGKRLDDKTGVAPRVGIIMGSDSDIPVMKSAAEILEKFGVPHEVKIVSAHQTPEMIISYASSAHDRGIQVIIAGAGGAAHLPGMVASLTHLPVIGVPVSASFMEGLDSLLSIVQMPKGVPVAAVGINNATNAGLLAVRCLGIANDNLRLRMIQYREEQKENVLMKGDKVEKHGWKSYLNGT